MKVRSEERATKKSFVTTSCNHLDKLIFMPLDYLEF